MKRTIQLLASIALAAFAACEGPAGLEGPQGATGETGPILTGQLQGSVELLDEFGELMLDHSGISVTLEGGDSLASAITNSSGDYVVEDLKTGTYNLVFSKEGFQRRRTYAYQFVGGNVPSLLGTKYLSAVSTTEILDFAISIRDENNPDTSKYSMVKIEYTISPASTPEEPRKIDVFVGTTTSVSINDYEFGIGSGTSGNEETYRFNKLESNTTYYAIAFPSSISCSSDWDPFLEERVNTCFGEPYELVSFTVP